MPRYIEVTVKVPGQPIKTYELDSVEVTFNEGSRTLTARQREDPNHPGSYDTEYGYQDSPGHLEISSSRVASWVVDDA